MTVQNDRAFAAFHDLRPVTTEALTSQRAGARVPDARVLQDRFTALAARPSLTVERKHIPVERLIDEACTGAKSESELASVVDATLASFRKGLALAAYNIKWDLGSAGVAMSCGTWSDSQEEFLQKQLSLWADRLEVAIAGARNVSTPERDILLALAQDGVELVDRIPAPAPPSESFRGTAKRAKAPKALVAAIKAARHELDTLDDVGMKKLTQPDERRAKAFAAAIEGHRAMPGSRRFFNEIMPALQERFPSLSEQQRMDVAIHSNIGTLAMRLRPGWLPDAHDIVRIAFPGGHFARLERIAQTYVLDDATWGLVLDAAAYMSRPSTWDLKDPEHQDRLTDIVTRVASASTQEDYRRLRAIVGTLDDAAVKAVWQPVSEELNLTCLTMLDPNAEKLQKAIKLGVSAALAQQIKAALSKPLPENAAPSTLRKTIEAVLGPVPEKPTRLQNYPTHPAVILDAVVAILRDLQMTPQILGHAPGCGKFAMQVVECDKLPPIVRELLRLIPEGGEYPPPGGQRYTQALVRNIEELRRGYETADEEASVRNLGHTTLRRLGRGGKADGSINGGEAAAVGKDLAVPSTAQYDGPHRKALNDALELLMRYHHVDGAERI